jgi:hypothetical protein
VQRKPIERDGEIRVQGARAPDVLFAASSTAASFDLGSSTRARPR